MNYEKRVCVLFCVVILSAYLLVSRLYNLTKPETNRSMTVLDGQYTARIDVCERNGFVYDRNGSVLSHEKDGRIALVNPAECKDALFCADELSKKALVSDCSDIYEKIMDGIPFTVMLKDSEDAANLDGVYIFDRYKEKHDTAIHFIGYNNSDGKGVCGIRAAYHDFLGRELYSKVSASFDTNAKRMSMSPFTLYTEKYLSSDGIVTTLDKDLQIKCDSLEEYIKSGAVVVSDVRTGEILALSSFPSYDVERIEDILGSDKGELVNRTVESFTPGSVFKIIVAAAALEMDESLWDYTYECKGSTVVDGNVFRCHNTLGHGQITMKEAFASSCNTYFISLGSLVGMENIEKTMKKLGLDKATCADFLQETNNYFIDTENTSSGYLANISFGQGDLCLSPLDMTRAVSAVSTGYTCSLSVIRGKVKDGSFYEENSEKRTRVFSDNTSEKMLIMMKECVQSGTGKYEGSQKVKSGGKTATAQTGRFDSEGVEYVHKWFCGVYPVDNPKYSVCILRDFSTEEGVSLAVIFGNICEYLNERGG